MYYFSITCNLVPVPVCILAAQARSCVACSALSPSLVADLIRDATTGSEDTLMPAPAQDDDDASASASTDIKRECIRAHS